MRCIFEKYLIVFCVFGMMAGTMAQQAAQPQAEAFQFEEPERPDPAREKLILARQALGERLYEPAVNFLKQYLSLVGTREPAFAEGVLMLANAYMAMDRASDALLAIDAYKEKKTKLPPGKLKNSLDLAQAKALALTGEWQAASGALKHLVLPGIEEPVRESAVILACDAAMQLGQWKALEELAEAYLKNSGCKSVRLKLSLIKACLNQGKTERAWTLLKEFPEKDAAGKKELLSSEEKLEISLLKIRVQALRQESEEAWKLYTQAREVILACDSPAQEIYAAFVALGDGLFVAGRHAEAAEIQKLALHYAGKKEEKLQPLASLVRIALVQNRMTEALDWQMKLKNAFPEHQVYLELTEAVARGLDASHSRKAAELFHELSLMPKLQPAKRYESSRNEGACWTTAGEYQNAQTAYLAAEKLGMNDEEKAEARFLAAEIARNQYLYLERQKQTAEGLAEAEKAIELFRSTVERYPKAKRSQEARFQQANLLQKSHQYQKAATAYEQFSKDYPRHADCNLALLKMGTCRRLAADTGEARLAAAKELEQIADRIAASPAGAADALLEAFRAALEAGDYVLARKELDTLIARKAPLERKAEAYYQRCLLSFSEEKGTESSPAGKEDYKILYDNETMREFGKHVELSMLMGDWYKNHGEWNVARDYYLRVDASLAGGRTGRHEVSRVAALYEAAVAAYHLEQYDEPIKGSLAILAQLESIIPAQKSAEEKRILARAYFLKGDVLSKKHDFTGASQAYLACKTTAVPNSELALAALGRQGDMYLQQGLPKAALKEDAEAQKAFALAEKCYSTLMETAEAAVHASPFGLMARYRLANAMKIQEKDEEALELYAELWTLYKELFRGKSPIGTHYLACTIFDMGELLEKKGDKDSLRRALDAYREFASWNLPTSPSALKKAENIEKKVPELKRLGK